MNIRKLNWAPYVLILPSFVYLILFFGWPMVRSMELAFRRDSQILSLTTEVEGGGDVAGKLERGVTVEVVNIVDAGGTSAAGGVLAKPELWYRVSGVDVEGNDVVGWAERGPVGLNDVKVSTRGTVGEAGGTLYEAADTSSAALTELEAGTEFTVLGWDELEEQTADGTWTKVQVGSGLQAKEWWVPTDALVVEDEAYATAATITVPDTPLRSDPYIGSPVEKTLEEGAAVSILPLERKSAPRWFQVQVGEDETSGWVLRDDVIVADPIVSTAGRVERGTGAKEWTLDYIKRMVRDRNFKKAMQNTVLLLVLILPLQFALAITMALVLQTRLKFNTVWLYIYSIPLGVSDLAAGLVWYSVFTQSGFLNSALETLGIIDSPITFISSENRHYIILAIVLAEVWRATSIVMVIVVSGLQAIPTELLEAGEMFGANLWQRLRYIILPLLRPSLQVALILRTILAFQVFAVVVAISGGEVVTVLANETYRWYDIGRYNNPNVAAAYSGFIMLLSLSVAVFYLRTVRSQEEGARK